MDLRKGCSICRQHLPMICLDVWFTGSWIRGSGGRSRREKDCFYLGLFGPDILFFYRSLNDNRIVHKGFWLHEEPARVLFFHGIKAWEKEKDPEKKAAIEAYLLGFACHFALDHSLHEYVNHTDDSTIFTHGEIETELDRRLLVREGMTPLRADVTSHVKNTSMTRLAASRVLSESRETVGECIMSFKAAMRAALSILESLPRHSYAWGCGLQAITTRSTAC